MPWWSSEPGRARGPAAGRGSRVVAAGRLQRPSWTAEDGSARSTAGVLPHPREAQVQAEEPGGEARQPKSGQGRGNDRQQQRGPEGELAGAKQPSEGLGVQLAEEWVGYGRHAMQTLGGFLPCAQLADPGIDDVCPGDERRG